MGYGSNRKILEQLGPFMNLGIELAATIGIFGVIGWFLDKTFDTSPIWLVVLLVIGSVGSLYKFIRSALKANKQQQTKD